MATETMPKMKELMALIKVDLNHKHFGRAVKEWYEAHVAWIAGGKTQRLDNIRQDKLSRLYAEARDIGVNPTEVVGMILDKYGF